jgi:hypothetical protein
MTTERIAELNDLLRKTFFVGGRVVTTPGIRALPEADQSAIREKVETFRPSRRRTIRTASATLALSATTATGFSGRSTITLLP